MISVVIRRTEEPKVIQMTQADLVRQLGSINGAEIILEDSWSEGLKKVRTPYFSLVEPDCVFSSSYFSSNVGLIQKAHAKTGKYKDWQRYGGGGGNQKLAMITSCLGVRDFGNRIYSYELDKVKDINTEKVTGKGWHIQPNRAKLNMKLYYIQVGFVPGAVIRTSAVKDIIEDELWDGNDLVKLSTALSFYFWNTGREVQLNPNTTYVSTDKGLEKPPLFDTHVPDKVANIFTQQGIGFVGV
jgi:hypothetical protein